MPPGKPAAYVVRASVGQVTHKDRDVIASHRYCGVRCRIVTSEFAARFPTTKQFIVPVASYEGQFFPIQGTGVIAHQWDK